MTRRQPGGYPKRTKLFPPKTVPLLNGTLFAAIVGARSPVPSSLMT